MEISERIAALVQYSKLSIPKFAVHVGFKTPQTVRELINGRTKTLSDAVQYKILEAYPEVNKEWLMTGEGEMIKKEQETSPAHDHTAEDALGSAEPVAMLIREISEHRKLTQKALEELAACQRLLSSSQELLHTSQAQLTTSQRQLSTAQGQVSTLIGHADDAPSHRRDTAPDLDRIPWEEVK